jgi:hypothetical protein
VQKKEDFSPSVFLIQMETIPGLRIWGNDPLLF